MKRPPRIAAIVLAAGKSERMGRPKALLPIRGRTFLENILDAIGQSSISDTVVITGHHRDEIERRIPLPAAVFNPDYEQGMITSFQTGIRALPSTVDGAVLFLVDHPLVHPATIESLITKFAPAHIILPVFEGRRGHPVLFASELLREVLDLTSSQGANIVVRKDPTRVIEVPVNEAGILVDIDTPDDYDKLRREI
jgi:molybdenum cofactor cytidylyltransferase